MPEVLGSIPNGTTRKEKDMTKDVLLIVMFCVILSLYGNSLKKEDPIRLYYDCREPDIVIDTIGISINRGSFSYGNIETLFIREDTVMISGRISCDSLAVDTLYIGGFYEK